MAGIEKEGMEHQQGEHVRSAQCMSEKEDVVKFSALLFYHLANVIVERFGEAGKEAVIEAIKNFGKERGEKIRQNVLSLGLEPNLENLSRFYDLPTSTIWKGSKRQQGDVAVSEIEYCPFAEVWIEHDAAEIGQLYCEVDKALREAYNPKIEFDPRKSVLRGDKQCEHRVNVKG